MSCRAWLFTALLLFSGCEKPAAEPRLPPGFAAQVAAATAAKREARARAAADTEKRFLDSPAGKVWNKHPAWDRELCGLVAERKIRLGMTREQARAAWGRPERVNRTVFPNRVHEQWVYGSNYLYFVNDILESWQD